MRTSGATTSFDRDGRLRVFGVPISAAGPVSYFGRELAADAVPDAIYTVTRGETELRRAAPTFRGAPLIRRHVACASEPGDVIGFVGDAWFDASASAICADLTIWDAEAIEAAASGARRELSIGFQYDLTPGTPARMTNMRGHHVALVPRTRGARICAIPRLNLERNHYDPLNAFA